MAWRAFNWGSRGPHWDAGNGVYVAQVLIPNGIQVNLQGNDTTGNELLHVFGAFSETSPITYDDCLAVANAVASWATSSLKPLIPTTFAIRQVIATARDVLEGPQAQVGIAIAGTRSGDPNPGNVTLALKKAGVVAARWAKGRFFMWPATTDDIIENRFQTGYVVDAISAYDTLRTALAGAGYPMVILSNSHARTSPVSVVTAVDTNVDSQRRRLNGRGR